jgi:transcriptional regulator with XRE-family HTH domain
MPRKNYGETSFGERLQAIRKARGLTQVQLAEAAGTTQRAISYYETEAGFPPSPAVIDLAKALRITTDELLGVKAPKVERINDDSESRRMWKRFQMVSTLPERYQKAVIRLIHSLVAAGPARRNAEQRT